MCSLGDCIHSCLWIALKTSAGSLKKSDSSKPEQGLAYFFPAGVASDTTLSLLMCSVLLVPKP